MLNRNEAGILMIDGISKDNFSLCQIQVFQAYFNDESVSIHDVDVLKRIF